LLTLLRAQPGPPLGRQIFHACRKHTLVRPTISRTTRIASGRWRIIATTGPRVMNASCLPA
jgi:hypothetical protein